MTNRTQQIIRLRLWHKQPQCVYCHRRLRRRSATVDHIIPRSKGGTDDDSNIALCCASCNAAKDDRTIIEWIADLLTAAAESGVLA